MGIIDDDIASSEGISTNEPSKDTSHPGHADGLVTPDDPASEHGPNPVLADHDATDDSSASGDEGSA